MNIMIFSFVLSILIGIIGYFLGQTMINIKKTTEITNKNTTDIALLTQDHNTKHANLKEDFTNFKDALKEDFKEFKEALKDLTKEIKELNTKFSERE